MKILTDFAKGIIAGVVCAALIFGVIAVCYYTNRRHKELIEYAEKQIEIEVMREDYRNRNAADFLDDVPGVRGAADGASAEFERKRNEAVQRFRGRPAD